MNEQLELFPKKNKELEGYLFTQAYDFFHKTFYSIKFSTFINKDLSILFKKPIIDINKFDDWLHNQYGDYEEQGLSMQDVLTKNYGQSVAVQIKGLLA